MNAAGPAGRGSGQTPPFLFEERWLSPRHKTVGYLVRLRRQAVSFAIFSLGLLGLLPLRAGEPGLFIPVSAASLKLPALSPALINMELPGGEPSISPASLGYFSKPGEFVFTGDEQRGVIYGYEQGAADGSSGGRVWLVEISTPQRAEEFLADYLAEIRTRVDKLNTCENQLRGARQDAAGGLSRAEQLADNILAQSADDLAGGGLDEWAGKVIAESARKGGEETYAALPQALETRAAARVKHKQMYYGTQESRLDLRLSTFELQLALARLPRPSMEGLISLGDEQLVRNVLAGELERLRENWNTRQQTLLSAVNAQRKWLARISSNQASAPAPPPPEPGEKLSSATLAGFGDPSPQLVLKQAAVEARLSVDTAELEELSRVLNELAQIEAYSKREGRQTAAGLPEYNIARQDFAPVKIEDLEQFSQVEARVGRADTALPLLIQLAQVFEKQDANARLQLNTPAANASGVRPGSGAGITPFPSETHYGLLIVDRCLREEAAGGLLRADPAPLNPQDQASAPATAADGKLLNPAAAPATLDQVLEGVINAPGNYGVEAADPGYLKFMHWYAGLLRASLPRPQ